MNKFWEWMDEKRYSGIIPEHCKKQMLIGYKIEYLIEKDVYYCLTLDMFGNIEKLNNYLDKVINEIG